MANTANTVHESIRVRSELVERVMRSKAADESKSAAYNRVIEAGLDALDGVEQPAGYEVPPEAAPQGADDGTLVAELRARVDALEEENGRLWKQLETKDQQIERAQQTTALATQGATRRRGLLGWLLGDRYNDR